MSVSRTLSEHHGASAGGEAALLQRKCACGQHTPGGGECEECRKKRMGTLRRSAVGPPAREEAPPIVHEVLRSPGQPLDAAVREVLEPRFGRDFSQVRVHADSRAAESAQAVDALAYTVGREIVFAGGRYEPGRGEGLKLLAHELTHVTQQEGRDASGPLRVGPAGDAFEQEADRMAEGAGPLHFGSAAAGLQRQAAFGDRAAAAADFEGCNPAVSQEIRSTVRPAIEHVDRAIAALAHGWDKMEPAPKAFFQQYFDPAGSGDIDDRFVREVRGNFQAIRRYMGDLSFVCTQGRSTVCGTSGGWCTGRRLMWTCFGTVYVCPAYATETDRQRKIQTIIHEATHNALWTTDREYVTSADFNRLKPRGSGILSFLSQIPVIGFIFRQFTANNDTLNNPDSYAQFAIELQGASQR